jgi:hypothetical protein
MCMSWVAQRGRRLNASQEGHIMKLGGSESRNWLWHYDRDYIIHRANKDKTEKPAPAPGR